MLSKVCLFSPYFCLFMYHIHRLPLPLQLNPASPSTCYSVSTAALHYPRRFIPSLGSTTLISYSLKRTREVKIVDGEGKQRTFPKLNGESFQFYSVGICGKFANFSFAKNQCDCALSSFLLFLQISSLTSSIFQCFLA